MKNNTMELIERKNIENFEIITVSVTDEKVKEISLRYNTDWNKLIDITVGFHSGRLASYNGTLSNHKMPIKYRNYIKQIEQYLEELETEEVTSGIVLEEGEELEEYKGYYIHILEMGDCIVYDSNFNKITTTANKLHAVLEIKKIRG
jgi:hypothetical protein